MSGGYDHAMNASGLVALAVLITGACGNLGRKLRAAWTDVYDLILIDDVGAVANFEREFEEMWGRAGDVAATGEGR